MTNALFIAAAANTLAPAHSELLKQGFSVSLVVRSGTTLPWIRAEKTGIVLEAEDALQLLGLATLAARRGVSWMPTDTEVDTFLRLQTEL